MQQNCSKIVTSRVRCKTSEPEKIIQLFFYINLAKKMLLNLFPSNLELKLKRVNNGINFGQSRILPLVKKM